MRFLLTYFDNQIIKCYKYLIDVQADIMWGWVTHPQTSVGGKHHYNDAALLLTKQIYFFKKRHGAKQTGNSKHY